LADAPSRKVTPAPPWLEWLARPLVARLVAREMMKQYPALGADEIFGIMRADLGANPDKAALRMIEAVRARLPAAPAAAGALTWRSPSSLALIASNLLALWGVIAWGWPVFPLLLLFWLENVVLGALNVLRMLLVDPADPALWGAKLFMVPFFCLHYGMFTAIHGVFVIGFLGDKTYDRMVQGLWTLDAAARAVRDFELWLPLAALAASHLFSFCWNYILGGEYRRASLAGLMSRPYQRVLVLHLTIIFGGWGVMLLGSPLWALLVLLGLKVWLDLKAHVKEHTRQEHAGRRSRATV
jgi:hypothetical protein